jgi:hypothetical protein
MQQSYIVRVYRHDKDNPRELVGLVEEVGKEGRRGFTNLDELWGILNSPDRRKIPKIRNRRRDGLINEAGIKPD